MSHFWGTETKSTQSRFKMYNNLALECCWLSHKTWKLAFMFGFNTYNLPLFYSLSLNLSHLSSSPFLSLSIHLSIFLYHSDGAGRSGTYILIDMVLNKMAKGERPVLFIRSPFTLVQLDMLPWQHANQKCSTMGLEMH